MSINHYYCCYTSSDLPQAQKYPWYFSQHNQHVMNMDYLTTTTSSSSPKPSSQFMAGEDNMRKITSYDHVEEDHRNEPLFEKPLTPSDVGKLNRLVIPKQHAEKHLPLSGDSVLLGFEDESGKMWRFRYSYWSSSQSYVLTKGWSRFVKDKQLDAGDIVRFSRSRTDCARLFIGYRRRRNSSSYGRVQETGGGVAAQTSVRGGGWGGALSYSVHQYNAYPSQFQGSSLSAPCQPDQDSCRVHADAEKQTTAASGNSRKLRLFGVNLECELPADDQSEPSTPVDSTVSSHDQSHHHPYYYQYYSNLHNNMDQEEEEERCIGKDKDICEM